MVGSLLWLANGTSPDNSLIDIYYHHVRLIGISLIKDIIFLLAPSSNDAAAAVSGSIGVLIMASLQCGKLGPPDFRMVKMMSVNGCEGTFYIIRVLHASYISGVRVSS